MSTVVRKKEDLLLLRSKLLSCAATLEAELEAFISANDKPKGRVEFLKLQGCWYRIGVIHNQIYPLLADMEEKKKRVRVDDTIPQVIYSQKSSS